MDTEGVVFSSPLSHFAARCARSPSCLNRTRGGFFKYTSNDLIMVVTAITSTRHQESPRVQCVVPYEGHRCQESPRAQCVVPHEGHRCQESPRAQRVVPHEGHVMTCHAVPGLVWRGRRAYTLPCWRRVGTCLPRIHSQSRQQARVNLACGPGLCGPGLCGPGGVQRETPHMSAVTVVIVLLPPIAQQGFLFLPPP